jgi:DNA-binding CsgD family transcriptional regulator
MAKPVLSEVERTVLELLSSRRKTAQALALRARIILECAQGSENQEVAASLGIAKNTVGKWRRRFVERRMDELHDEARSSAPRSIADDRIEAWRRWKDCRRIPRIGVRAAWSRPAAFRSPACSASGALRLAAAPDGRVPPSMR